MRFLPLTIIGALLLTAGQADAGSDIKMLPPSGCPTGISGVLGWDGRNPLGCISGFTAGYDGSVSMAGDLSVGGNVAANGSIGGQSLSSRTTAQIGDSIASATTVNAANSLAALLASCTEGAVQISKGKLACGLNSTTGDTCAPSTQIRNVGCPEGQIGVHMQERDLICSDKAEAGSWGTWYDVGNTCAASALPSCGAGAALVADGRGGWQCGGPIASETQPRASASVADAIRAIGQANNRLSLPAIFPSVIICVAPQQAGTGGYIYVPYYLANAANMLAAPVQIVGYQSQGPATSGPVFTFDGKQRAGQQSNGDCDGLSIQQICALPNRCVW